MHFSLFFQFFFMIYTYYVILGVIFELFHAQSLKAQVLIVQKNPLLECLTVP